MLEILGCAAVLVISLLFLQFLKLQWARRHLPPGPVPIPILGTLWCFGFGWGQDTLSQVSKAYGKIFTIWIGHIPMVAVNGFCSVKGLLTIYSKETSWRVVTPFVKDTMKEKGILFSSGDVWKEQRRLGTLILRTLGLGKKTLEHWIQKEAADLVEHFASLKGEPMNPTFPLFLAILNVISYVTFGHRFSMKDETFRKLISCIQYQSHFFLSTFHLLYEVCPWLMRRLPGPHQKAFSGLETIHSFARSEIRRHKENRKADDPQDFIDYYLEEIDKQKGNPKSTFNENDLVYVIHDLFTAGTDTVVSSLLWALLLMVAHPDIQERVQEEIDGVLEPSQDIFYEDRKSLPYTNAVIHEVLRFRFVLLAGTFRQCAKDSNIFGFPIKKGTVIIPDVASALNDPEEWETPHQFNPDHFLDKDGQFRVRDAFIPFSVGQRLCLGDNLAKTELFIFMTNVLREFKLQLPDGVKEVDTTPVRGRFIVQPHPYKICAVPRKEKTAPERGWENRA